MLPASDRPVVLKALHTNPDQRFDCCTDLIDALESGGVPRTAPSTPKAQPLAPTPIPAPPDQHAGPRVVTKRPLAQLLAPVRQALGKVVENAAGRRLVREFNQIRYLLQPGEGIEHHCFARLVPGLVNLYLDSFAEQWSAELVDVRAGTYVYHVPIRGSVIERFFGVWPTLAVEVHCQFPDEGPVGLAALAVHIKPRDCGQRRALDLLERAGPLLLESLRNILRANPDRRGEERLPFERLVEVIPVHDDERVGDAITGLGRDISLHGMGLTVPHLPGTPRVCVRFAWSGDAAPLTLLAKVVSVQECPGGRHAVGLFFLQNLVP
jgi:PilZ domain